MKLKSRLALISQGTIGGLIASVCCALPATVIAAGLSGGVAATLISVGRLRLYTLIVGLAFIGIASWFSLRHSRACCTQEEYQHRLVVVPLTMVISFGVVYGLIIYLIVPILYRSG